MATNGGPQIVRNGLVLCLDAANRRSYPTTGTTWTDLSGGNNNATLINGATFNTSNGGSIQFDGVNDYATVSDITGVTDFSNTDNYTVSFWFNPDTGNSTQDGILEKWATSGGYPYAIRFGISGNDFGIGVWNGSQNPGAGPFNLTLNSWQLITVVFHHSITQLNVYYNGIQIDSQPLSISGTITNSSPLYIMSRPQISSYSKGNIANLSIYNRALSETEVLQNYNATKSRFGL